MVSIKACDESSAPPGKKTMGNQWLIKLMLYSPPGYKYSRRSEGERLGWDLRGSKAAPQRSRGINWDFVLYDGLGKQCSTFDVPEVFVALGPFRTEAPCVAFTGFQALSQRFRQNAIKLKNTWDWGFGESTIHYNNKLQFHTPRTTRNFLSRKQFCWSLLYSGRSPACGIILGILKISHPITLPYAHSAVLCPTA